MRKEAAAYEGYLKKLEGARAEGKISESVYERLKGEYLEKLSAIKARIKELEEARRA